MAAGKSALTDATNKHLSAKIYSGEPSELAPVEVMPSGREADEEVEIQGVATPMLGANVPDAVMLLSHRELMEEFGLNNTEALFVGFYVANPTNAAKAAVAAGYKPTNRYSISSELIKKPSVAAAIAHEMNKLQERTRITADRVLHELAIIGFSNINDFVVDEEGNLTLRPGVPEYMLRAVQSVKRKITKKREKEGWVTYIELEIKLWGKMEALHLAGKHLGLLNDKVNVNVSGNVTHQHEQVWEFGGRKIVFR